MKKSFLFLASLLSAQLVSAQIFTDNFDLYNAGEYLGVNSSIWTTWTGVEGGALDVSYN